MKLAQWMLLACSITAFANAANYNIILYEKTQFGGSEIKPGEYKLEVNGGKARLYDKKQSVEAPVKMESTGEKFSATSVRYATEGGTHKVVEIRLGGTNTRLAFD